MADGCNGPALLVEGPNQVNHGLIRPKVIRVADSAGQQQGVEVLGARLVDLDVGPDGLPRIVVDRRLDRLQVRRCKNDLGAFTEKDLPGTEQFGLLKPVRGNDQHFGI
jgi:hypothetical protein